MTLNLYKEDIIKRAEGGETLTSIARSYDVTGAGICVAIKRWGVKLISGKGRVGRPFGSASRVSLFVRPIVLPVLQSGFIKAPTRARLMAGK